MAASGSALATLLKPKVGYIAWGIGLLAGIGVRVAANEDDLGMMSGFAAILSASALKAA